MGVFYNLFMSAIIGISVKNRLDDAQKLQEILTRYGCAIKTRIGLHDMGEFACGIVLLEVVDKVHELYQELSKSWDVQIMKF